MSLVESLTNMAVGYMIGVAARILVSWLSDLRAPRGENLLIGRLFTVTSLCREQILRRLFNSPWMV
jgi:hypothetical protein